MRAHYEARINRVIDHIEANLSSPLTLKALAKIACFSPHHFHRIFHGMVGETLSRFILRLRLERAARRLLDAPDLPVTDVALDGGFSSPSVFARSFKAHFGMSASDFRRADRKDRKAVRKPGQPVRRPGTAPAHTRLYLHPTTGQPVWEVKMSALQGEITVQTLAPMTIAYVRKTGDYRDNPAFFGELWGTLMRWAAARGLAGAQSLCIYHDNPEITAPERLRVSAGVVVPEGTVIGGSVGRMTLEGGRYAIARFRLRPGEHGEAWRAVFGSWLPDSGFVPTDQLCFERYGGRDGERQEVSICVPVQPMEGV